MRDGGRDAEAIAEQRIEVGLDPWRGRRVGRPLLVHRPVASAAEGDPAVRQLLPVVEAVPVAHGAMQANFVGGFGRQHLQPGGAHGAHKFRQQALEAAVNATKSFEDRKIADYLRKSEMQTIVGPVSFNANGERAKSAVFQAQFRGIKNDDVDQFKQTGKQIVVWPDNLKQGNLITPFDAARKAS